MCQECVKVPLTITPIFIFASITLLLQPNNGTQIWVQSKKHHFMNWKMGHKKEMGDGSKNEQTENILFIGFPQRLHSNCFKNYGPGCVTHFIEEINTFLNQVLYTQVHLLLIE